VAAVAEVRPVDAAVWKSEVASSKMVQSFNMYTALLVKKTDY